MSDFLNVGGAALMIAGLALMLLQLARLRAPDGTENPFEGLSFSERRRIMRRARSGEKIEEHNAATTVRRYMVWHLRLMSESGANKNGWMTIAGVGLLLLGSIARSVAASDVSVAIRWGIWVAVWAVIALTVWNYRRRLLERYRQTASANGWELR